MEVLPADSSALVGCEPWQAWRVIGLSAALTRCVGHGVCSCMCVNVRGCLVALSGVRLKRIYQKHVKFSLKSILGVTSQVTYLNQYIFLNIFSSAVAAILTVVVVARGKGIAREIPLTKSVRIH